MKYIKEIKKENEVKVGERRLIKKEGNKIEIIKEWGKDIPYRTVNMSAGQIIRNHIKKTEEIYYLLHVVRIGGRIEYYPIEPEILFELQVFFQYSDEPSPRWDMIWRKKKINLIKEGKLNEKEK